MADTKKKLTLGRGRPSGGPVQMPRPFLYNSSRPLIFLNYLFKFVKYVLKTIGPKTKVNEL